MQIIDPAKIAEHVSRDADLSIAEQVANLLEMWLASGTVQAGDRVPSVRDLVAALGVSHNTARRCQEAMKARGLIVIVGNRAYCANLTAARRRNVREKYKQITLASVLAYRESGADMKAVQTLIEQAYAMERGPYAAV